MILIAVRYSTSFIISNVFVSHKDKDCLANILKAELNKLSLWFRANRLSLNLKKNKFIVFKPCQKRTNQTIQLLINSQKIDQVKETVFLGVIMHENWNWKSEISHVANKLSKCTGIIRKSSFYLSTKTLRTLYFSLVYPYFFYCNLVWASTYRTNLIRLEILQKRVIRTIAKTTFDAQYWSNLLKSWYLKISWYILNTTRLIHVLLSKPYSTFKISL